MEGVGLREGLEVAPGRCNVKIQRLPATEEVLSYALRPKGFQKPSAQAEKKSYSFLTGQPTYTRSFSCGPSVLGPRRHELTPASALQRHMATVVWTEG